MTNTDEKIDEKPNLQARDLSPEEVDELLEQGRHAAEVAERELRECTHLTSSDMRYRVR